MKKYVLYTPNEKGMLKCDTVFISKHVVNGELVKKYAGKEKLELAIKYASRNDYVLIVAFLQHLGATPIEVISIVNRIRPERLICIETSELTYENIESLFFAKSPRDEYSALCSSMLKKGKSGTPENFNNEGRHKGGETMKRKAQDNPHNQTALEEVKRLKGLNEDCTLQSIADSLNRKRMRTPTGKLWSVEGIRRLWDKYESFRKDKF